MANQVHGTGTGTAAIVFLSIYICQRQTHSTGVLAHHIEVEEVMEILELNTRIQNQTYIPKEH